MILEKIDNYLNEGKFFGKYIAGYAEGDTDTSSDGIRALNNVKNLIENNYDTGPIGIDKNNLELFFEYRRNSKNILKKGKKFIAFNWSKKEYDKYKGKKFTEVWSLSNRLGMSGVRYEVENDNDIKKFLNKWEVPKK